MAIDAGEGGAGSGARGGFLGSRAFAIVRLAVTAVIVGGLIFKLSPGELGRTFRHADAWLLIAALAMMAGVQGLVVLKWAVLLRAREISLAPARLVRAYCVGSLLTNVLPTGVGGDPYRVFRVQQEGNARAADVAMSVVYERATGYAAMGCLGALGLAFYRGSVPIGLVALAGGVAVALAIAYALPRVPFPALREGHVLRNLLAHRKEMVIVYQMAIFSLAIQALYISTIAVAGRALGIHVSWWYWAFSTWVVALAVLTPLTLGGLGVRESGYSALLTKAGATAAQGASAGFALGLLLIGANALGLALVEGFERLEERRAHVGDARPEHAATVADVVGAGARRDDL